MSENNSKREHLSASVILILMGALATFGGFILNSTMNEVKHSKQQLESHKHDFQVWKERVLPLDTWQSTSLGEMDRFLEMFWNRHFPSEPYPKMRTPPPMVQP